MTFAPLLEFTQAALASHRMPDAVTDFRPADSSAPEVARMREVLTANEVSAAIAVMV